MSLTSFTKQNTVQVQPCCYKWKNISFCFMSNIPLYHIFIHSSVDAHLAKPQTPFRLPQIPIRVIIEDLTNSDIKQCHAV